MLWTLDGTKYAGTIWSADEDSLLFRTDVHGEAGVVRIALQDIDRMRVEEEPTGPRAPALVKIGFWGLIGFAVIVLVTILIDEPLVDLSPASN